MTIVLNDKSVNKRQRKKNDAIKNGQWKDTGNRTKTNIATTNKNEHGRHWVHDTE